MAYQSDIEKAFLAKFATLGLSNVSYPNGPSVDAAATDIKYVIDTLYGEATASAISYDAANRHVGLFQVRILAPTTSATGDAPGIRAALDAADAIAAAYVKGTVLPYPALPASPTVQVQCRSPIITHLGRVSDGAYTIVVRVGFWADVSA